MPLTPDDMPDFPEDNEPTSRPRMRNGSNGAAARMAHAAADDASDVLDDAGDIDTEDGEELQEAPASFSDLVRQSPIGALVGAFVAGFLVARLI